jgi:hypothetical protein
MQRSRQRLRCHAGGQSIEIECGVGAGRLPERITAQLGKKPRGGQVQLEARE